MCSPSPNRLPATPTTWSRLLQAVVLVLATGCRKHDNSQNKTNDNSHSVAPIAPVMVGVETIAQLNFMYDEGASAYQKATALYKKPVRDWAAIAAQCQAALDKDVRHLDARRLLVAALSAQGLYADVAEQLLQILSADFLRYSPGLQRDPELAAFWSTAHGIALQATMTKMRADFTDRANRGVWFIGRRSTFKLPTKLGQWAANSRGEIYSYDLETKRFLRLTHTNHQVAAYAVGPNDEIALLTFDRIDNAPLANAPITNPQSNSSDQQSTRVPLMSRAWITRWKRSSWQPINPKVAVPVARQISFGYHATSLLVRVAPALDRWAVGSSDTFVVDATKGQLSPTQQQLTDSVTFNLDDSYVSRSTTGFVVKVDPQRPDTATLTTGDGTAVVLPNNALVDPKTLSSSPSGEYIAFATAVDACDNAQNAILHVTDKQGASRQLATARKMFSNRWSIEGQLIYDDGETIHGWDAVTGTELWQFTNPTGLGLQALQGSQTPMCKSGSAAPAMTPEIELEPEIEIEPEIELNLAP
jgi:hypothetical protein